jgi:hypothetical protein
VLGVWWQVNAWVPDEPPITGFGNRDWTYTTLAADVYMEASQRPILPPNLSPLWYNEFSGRCITVSSGQPQSEAFAFPCQQSVNERFEFRSGSGHLVSEYTGLCLSPSCPAPHEICQEFCNATLPLSWDYNTTDRTLSMTTGPNGARQCLSLGNRSSGFGPMVGQLAGLRVRVRHVDCQKNAGKYYGVGERRRKGLIGFRRPVGVWQFRIQRRTWPCGCCRARSRCGRFSSGPII